MLKDQAATQKQLDDINAQIKVLDKQIQSVGTQNSSISSEVKAIDMQIAQLKDQLSKSRITNPVNGTVLSTFAEAGEIALMGKTLYKIADLNHLFLRVYMDATQLANVKVGQKVAVFVDKNKDENIKIYALLSYGDLEYGKKVLEQGELIFGDKFIGVVEYMDFENFVKFMNKMDLIIFNHERQQAFGNLLLALYLKKKIFMNTKS
ncbi:MAG: HlyD family efflux transporter periplasmic adaptor subunit, partial [Pedobacter sp.]